MTNLNQVQGEPFTEQRQVHQFIVSLSCTLPGVTPWHIEPQVYDNESGYWCRPMREDWDEAAWQATLEQQGFVGTPEWSDLCRTLTYGA